MSTNDRVVLDEILRTQHSNLAPDLSTEEYFQLFCIEQILKSYDLSYDEIEAGIVDGGDDGGVDAVYTFANGRLLSEDANVSQQRDALLELHIVQTKRSASFSETAIDRIRQTLRDVLQLDIDLHSFRGDYNERLLANFRIFRKAALELAPSFPKVELTVHYASRGSTADIHPKVLDKAQKLEDQLADTVSDAAAATSFLGATELLRLAQTSPPTTYELDVTATISTEREGFACLVTLPNYYHFTANDDGNIRGHLFESNVRDYQGRTEVNEHIRATLTGGNGEDFWWLNNGVTVVASQVSLAGKTLTVENPQIVNGLQTSQEIFKYFQTNDGAERDQRQVLVRVLVPDSDESRDRIIRATNSQTAIPTASLWATDELQRKIEEFLRTRDLYYERRKNYYKNQGIRKDHIISISYLAQAIMASLLGEPDNARARPSSLLKTDTDYRRVFSEEFPIDAYFNAAVLMRRIDKFLLDRTSFTAGDRNNLKYHMALVLVVRRLKTLPPDPKAYAAQDFSAVGDAELEQARKIVSDSIDQLCSDPEFDGSIDRVAKSNELVIELRRRLLGQP